MVLFKKEGRQKGDTPFISATVERHEELLENSIYGEDRFLSLGIAFNQN